MQRVLIVDDEQTLRETFRAFLEMEEQYEVETADSVDAARDVLAASPVDVIVSDIQMPGQSGVDLLRNLREKNPEVNVILVTGEPDISTASNAVRLGAFDYLSKPVDAKEFLRVVAAAARDKNLRDENIRLQRENEAYRMQLEHMVEAQGRELSAAYRFMKQLTTLADLDDTIDTILAQVAEQLDCRRAAVLLQQDNLLVLRGGVGLNGCRVYETAVPVGQYICGRVFAEQQQIIGNGSPEPGDDPLLQHLPNPIFAAVPLMDRANGGARNVLGTLTIADREGGRPFTEDDVRVLSYMADAAAVAINNQIHRRSFEELTYQTMSTLISAVEARDPYTCGHTLRVTRNAMRLGRHMGLENEELQALEAGCALHDVGKIGIPDAVLNKKGPLTNDEFAVIKNHPLIGARMVSHLAFLQPSVGVIRHHHERFDGKGYPDALAGEDIPLQARILAVADTFDAMTSSRPYRPALSIETALAELQRFAGSQFDKRCVEGMLELARQKELVTWSDAADNDPISTGRAVSVG